MLADLGRTVDALKACQSGAMQCLVTGDRKARAELLELHAGLTDEEV
jgi:hypothetical protein